MINFTYSSIFDNSANRNPLIISQCSKLKSAEKPIDLADDLQEVVGNVGSNCNKCVKALLQDSVKNIQKGINVKFMGTLTDLDVK